MPEDSDVLKFPMHKKAFLRALPRALSLSHMANGTAHPPRHVTHIISTEVRTL